MNPIPNPFAKPVAFKPVAAPFKPISGAAVPNAPPQIKAEAVTTITPDDREKTTTGIPRFGPLSVVMVVGKGRGTHTFTLPKGAPVLDVVEVYHTAADSKTPPGTVRVKADKGESIGACRDDSKTVGVPDDKGVSFRKVSPVKWMVIG